MKKWNLVIDVRPAATTATTAFWQIKTSSSGNDFPPYSVAQPWSGQRWMNIERKERGQYPIVQVAYLPQPCMHCDEAPCIKESPAGAVYKREDGLVIIDPAKAKGHPEIVDTVPLRRHLLERGSPGRSEMYRVRPSARRGLDRDPLLAGLSHRRPHVGPGRRRRDGPADRCRGARGLQARTRHQASRPVQEPLPLGEGLRLRERCLQRHRRMRRRRQGDGDAPAGPRWAKRW